MCILCVSTGRRCHTTARLGPTPMLAPPCAPCVPLAQPALTRTALETLRVRPARTPWLDPRHAQTAQQVTPVPSPTPTPRSRAHQGPTPLVNRRPVPPVLPAGKQCSACISTGIKKMKKIIEKYDSYKTCVCTCMCREIPPKRKVLQQ
jgi:hypothetical protein